MSNNLMHRLMTGFRRIRDRELLSRETLLSPQEGWERTFDAISDPIMILDMGYRIVKANKALSRAAGVTSGQAVGRSCYDLVHGTQAPPDYCPYAKLIGDGAARSQEIYEPRFGGHFLVTVSPLHGPDGRLIGAVHAARDINELKKAEELRLRFSRNLERLLFVSHETTVTADLNGLYRAFVGASMDILALDFSTLMLLSEDKKTLTVRDCLGFPETRTCSESGKSTSGMSPHP